MFADRTEWTRLPGDRRYLCICQRFSIKIRRVTEVCAGKYRRNSKLKHSHQSPACLAWGVEDGPQLPVVARNHDVRMQVMENFPRLRFSVFSFVLFFSWSSAPRPLHGKRARSRQDLDMLRHYQKWCRNTETWGSVFLCGSCTKKREQFRLGDTINSLVSERDSAPGLLGMFVSCIMGSDYQLG